MTIRAGSLPGGYCPNTFQASDEYEKSYSELSGTDDSSSSERKLISLNSTSHDSFGVPTKVFSLSSLSSSERENLLHRLKQELERVRSCRKKVKLQRSTGVSLPSSSGVSLPSSSGVSLSKTSGKSHCSTGPGKKVIPLNATRPAPISTTTMLLMKQCETVLKRIMSHQYACIFQTPVDVVKLNIPDYFDVIKHPMDLGTIKSKLTSGTYSSPVEFAADVRLTFTNAMTYNPPGHDVHIMADTLRKFFEVRWKPIEKKLPGTKPDKLPMSSGLHEDREIAKPLSPLKKRGRSLVDLETISKPVKRLMMAEEKCKLVKELDALGEIPMDIVNFLKEHCRNGNDVGENEIEVDIHNVDDDILFLLRERIDEYMRERQTKHSSSEPCEIELLHGSGPSNSSMLQCGIEVVDEDVDDGENEPPVSSMFPVKTEKDAVLGISSDLRHAGSGCNDPKSTSPPTALMVPEAVKSESRLGKNKRVPLIRESLGGLSTVEDASQEKPSSVEPQCRQDGNSASIEMEVSSEKRYRAAVLKNRFADLILKAREKALPQKDQVDPEILRLKKEELEQQKKKEKARLQAEAKAAEEARRRAEAEEAKRKIELEREAARQALIQMEKMAEVDKHSRFLQDLELLKTAEPDQLPNSVDADSPELSHDGFGSFNFRGSNPLEQLGLFMKHDDEDDEPEPASIADSVKEVEEGEID